MPSGTSSRPYLTDEFVEAVRAAVDPEAVFREFLPSLTSRGTERSAFCPFHENHDTPALGLNVVSGKWTCRNPKCGAGGDLFAFYMRVRSLDFPAAVLELAERASVARPLEPADEATEALPPIPEALVAAHHLRVTESPAYIALLARKRGLCLDTIREFQIGHDGDRFVIPVRDLEGACRNLRRYKPGGTPKMLSYAEGYGTTRMYPMKAFETPGPVLVVESELDALLCRQLGFNAVSCTGGAGTWMAGFSVMFAGRDVTLMYDADDPGRDGAEKVARAIHGTAASVRVVTYSDGTPAGTDATDLVVRDGWSPVQVHALVDAAQIWTPSVAQQDDGELSPETGREGGVDARPSGVEPGKRPPQAVVLLGILEGARVELWTTPEGSPYATLPVRNGWEHHPVRGAALKDWLTLRWHRTQGGAVSSSAVEQVLRVCESRASLEGETHPVHVRLAEHGGAVFVDLSDGTGRVVKVTSSGWTVVGADEVPVRFRRPRGTLPHPMPERGGSLDLLRQVLNARDAEVWALTRGALIGAFRGRGPFPIVVVQGEQGSSKSTFARYVRALVDPRTPAHRAAPDDDRQLAVYAENSFLLSFDNLSGVPAWLSDGLCRIATGAGFGARSLYSNSDEFLSHATRPIMLNGITQLVEREDLASRALVLNLPSIPETERRQEAAVDAEFERIRPLALGALLDATSHALRELPNVRLDRLPRLADFAAWATAAEPALGFAPGEFLEHFAGSQEETMAAALESNAVVMPLLALVRGHGGHWRGDATTLLQALNAAVPPELRPRHGWPGAPKSLSNLLKRAVPALRAQGVAVVFGKSDRSRFIDIRVTPEVVPF